MVKFRHKGFFRMFAQNCLIFSLFEKQHSWLHHIFFLFQMLVWTLNLSARNGPMKENVYPTKLTWIRSAPIPARRVKPAQVSIYRHPETQTDSDWYYIICRISVGTIDVAGNGKSERIAERFQSWWKVINSVRNVSCYEVSEREEDAYWRKLATKTIRDFR